MPSAASRTGQATVLVMVPASVEEVPGGAAGRLWAEDVLLVAEASEDSDTVPFITDYSSYNSRWLIVQQLLANRITAVSQ